MFRTFHWLHKNKRLNIEEKVVNHREDFRIILKAVKLKPNL